MTEPGAERNILHPVFRNRLGVIADSVADLVASVGGWLTDHSLAGWDVIAFTPNAASGADETALRILGVASLTTAGLLPEHPSQRLTAVAMSHAVAPAVIEIVSRELAGGAAKLTVWGGCGPDDGAGPLIPVEYRMSRLATDLKTYALRSVGFLGPVSEVESVHCGKLRRVRPRALDADSA